MEIEYKWTIEDDVLKESFGKLGIDDIFFPMFKERALYRLNDIAFEELEPYDIDDSIENASLFIKEYAIQKNNGKSQIYSKQYALHILGDYDPAYCELYASKYEECINKGRDHRAAVIIATEYRNLYGKYWPEDDNYLGIEAHKGYMKGFEYAIDNCIGSPGTFAEDYMKAYLHSLFPDEEEPPCKSKGKYDDIISKLLLNTD